MLSRIFEFSFIDECGIPLDGGMLQSFVSGETTEAVTYDQDGNVNENPVILDARGCARIYIDNACTYDFILRDREGRFVCSFDKITANTKTFQAVGSSTIEATEATVDGKTVVTFRVKENSVGREELKNPRMLLDDGETTELVHKTVNGVEYVVVKAVVPKPSGTATMTLKYADGEVKWVADV